MVENNWSHCDITLKPLSKRLKPEENVKLDSDTEFTISPAMSILACAFAQDMPSDLALTQLRSYILSENQELKDDEFSLAHGWNDHMMSGYPDDKDILFVTPDGCTLGPPSQKSDRE